MKHFCSRPPFIFKNKPSQKEIGAVRPPGAEICPVHSGEFSKVKTTRRSARIGKVYFTDPHFFSKIIRLRSESALCDHQEPRYGLCTVGNFQKSKTSRRSARIEKVYFTDPHFFSKLLRLRSESALCDHQEPRYGQRRSLSLIHI